MHRRRRHRRRRHGFGRGRFFGPGEVRLALLSLLADGPKHGYELMRQLEERTDGAYRASAGTVYPTLSQLEDEGLARPEPHDGRRVYALTEAGRSAVEAARDEIDEIWRRAERGSDWRWTGDPDLGELGRPVLRVMRSAARALRRGADPDLVVDALDALREKLDALGRERPER